MKSKYKVLIVDQDEAVLCMLKNSLEQEAYLAETSQSAADALEKVKRDKYHILLIDTDLPDMNGIDLLKEIKSYDALTQVIMLAEHSSMEKIFNSLEYGANDYLRKPLASAGHVLQVIDHSVQKLERWRESIIQVVK